MLVVIASLVVAVGAYSRAKAHSNGVAIRQLEPDAKYAQKHVGNAAATASDEKLPRRCRRQRRPIRPEHFLPTRSRSS